MESEQDFFSDRSSNAWYPKSKYNPHEESTSKKHPSMPREISDKHFYDALVRLDTARYDDQAATSDGGEEEVHLKLKIAIGFAIGCGILLLVTFLVLLYKLFWFRWKTDAKPTPSPEKIRKPFPKRQPSLDLSPQRGQWKRHRPLMKSDSSLSDTALDSTKTEKFGSPIGSDSDNGVNGEPILNLGRLEFAVSYDTDNEFLHVRIISAYDLPTNSSTSYVEVYLLPDKSNKHQTHVIYEDPHPMFDETFKFDVSYSELVERTLHLCVFSFDGFSRHQALGEVFYSFDLNSNLEADKPLTITKDITRDVMMFREETPVRAGEVLVSLCYLPTTGRLTFVVLKARLSKNVMENKQPNPFAKVSLMLAGRQIKKTKTSVAKKTLNPVYNEAFVFDVPVHRLSDVSLLVRMLDRESVDDGENGPSRLLGKIVVGPDSHTSIGLHHWNCMMTAPRRPIAQWHPLLQM